MDGLIEDARAQDVRLGEFTLHVRFVDPFTPRERQTIAAHGGLIVQLGPIEVGKSADFVVLEKNLFEVEAHEISTVGVEKTYYKGRETYSAR